MKEKRKIIIAGACIFPGGSGGAARCMHMLAKGFAANGNQVEVVTTYGDDQNKREVDIDNFQARSFAYLSGHVSDPRYLNKLKIHFMILANLLNRTINGDYDLLLFYGPVLSFALVAAVAAIINRCCVYFMADIQPKPANMSLVTKLKRLLINVVDISLANLSGLVVILGTSKLVQRYARFAPKSSRLQILAPADTGMFVGGNGLRFKEKFNLEGKKIVTYCGTLDTLEGIDILLAGIGIVAQKCPDVVLVIAGKALDIDQVLGKKMDFQAFAQDFNAASYTIFTGHLPMQDVVDLLNASDVLVMPKIDHPLNHVASPIKIAEYLAAGRPIVSSRICELDKHLKHMEHVIFCEPGSAKDLADAINLVLADETLQSKLSSNASAIAKSLFDYRTISRMICEHVFLQRQ